MAAYPSTTDLSDAFFSRVVAMCGRLECAPLDLLAVAASESGVRARAHNANGDASGLWQLMPRTARGLGWPASDPHLDRFRDLTAEEQLTWWERYFLPHRGSLKNAAACYVATFLPALLKHAGDPAFVLCGRNGPLAFAYGPNASFDRTKKGTIVVSDLTDAIRRACAALGARWQEIEARTEHNIRATASLLAGPGVARAAVRVVSVGDGRDRCAGHDVQVDVNDVRDGRTFP